jgi:16S rRNA (uracil1498-N3)-methyltransferase
VDRAGGVIVGAGLVPARAGKILGRDKPCPYIKMVRRRFYAPPEAFIHESVTLSADETNHLRNVLRLEAGNEVFVFNGEGREFRCRIQSIARLSTTISVVQEVEAERPESPLNLTMAVALLKGEKLDLVLQKLTELGVTRVIPIMTARADVRIRNDGDADRKVSRWQRIVMEATKQCGRACLMKIETPITFRDLLHLPTSNEIRIMFSERGGISLTGAEASTSVMATVGSEGGWTDEEIDHARAAGWKIVTLAGRILRAETAAITVAALLQHRFGDLV